MKRDIPKDNITLKQASTAADWFRRIMGLEDWKTEISISHERPVWIKYGEEKTCGSAVIEGRWKLAKIWVNPIATMKQERYKTLEWAHRDVLTVLFHECCHMLNHDATDQSGSKDREEYMWVRVAYVLAAVYRVGIEI